jgi:hypothetical protein
MVMELTISSTRVMCSMHCVNDFQATSLIRLAVNVLRVKSLLSYAYDLGYTPFNAGTTIKVRSDAAHRGAEFAKRIISEVEVGLLVRAAPSKRDRVLLEVIYAAACGSRRRWR